MTVISTEQATACMALRLHKDSWSCSHLASRQRPEHLFFRDDGGSVLVMLLRGGCSVAFGHQQPNPGVEGGEQGSSLEGVVGRPGRDMETSGLHLHLHTLPAGNNGGVFHSLPSPAPLLRVRTFSWSRLGSCTGVCPWLPVRGAQPHPALAVMR